MPKRKAAAPVIEIAFSPPGPEADRCRAELVRILARMISKQVLAKMAEAKPEAKP